MKKIALLTLIIVLFSACKQKENMVDTKNTTQDEQTTAVKACTKDAKVCPDGSSVGRNPKNNCEFFECPKPAKNSSNNNSLVNGKNGKGKGQQQVMCTADVKQCPDGTFVGRDHSNKCKFKPCPSE